MHSIEHQIQANGSEDLGSNRRSSGSTGKTQYGLAGTSTKASSKARASRDGKPARLGSVPVQKMTASIEYVRLAVSK